MENNKLDKRTKWNILSLYRVATSAEKMAF